MGHLIYSPLDRGQKRHYTNHGSFAALSCCLEDFYQLKVVSACGNREGSAVCTDITAVTRRDCRGVLCRVRSRTLMILVGPSQLSIFCDPGVLPLFGSGSVTHWFCEFFSVTQVLLPQGALRGWGGRARAPSSRARARRTGGKAGAPHCACSKVTGRGRGPEEPP